MKISEGKKNMPHLILVHGRDGVGKTTLASEFPRPLFIGPEQGSFNIDASRVDDVDNWDKLKETLRDVYKLPDTKRYKTVVIDSLDWCELMIMEHICNSQNQPSIELCSGGFGKGYMEVRNEFIEMQRALNFLRAKGFNVVLICHSNVAEFNDPAADHAYNRYELKLFKSKSGNVDCRALWREFVDAVIYLHDEVVVSGDKQNNKNIRGSSTDRTLMELKNNARWDAKNRFGIKKPIVFKIGQGYQELNKALKGV